MVSYWVPIGFLLGSNGFPLGSYGFLWVLMDSYGCLLGSYWVPMGSYVFLGVPVGSFGFLLGSYGFLCLPMGSCVVPIVFLLGSYNFHWVPIGVRRLVVAQRDFPVELFGVFAGVIKQM